MIINQREIQALDQRYRTMFINSLAGFRQAVLVGTKSPHNQTNLAIFNSLIHLGADPALFGLISRPDTVQRDTLQNMINTKEFSLNYVKSDVYKKAHQTSARYPKGVSEFEKTGLKAVYEDGFSVPFVENAVVKIAMKYEESILIPLNGTVLIVGSILQVCIDDQLVGEDGFVNLSASKVLISQGLDAYFISQELGRLPYAKP